MYAFNFSLRNNADRSTSCSHLLEYIRLYPERLSPTHPTVLLVSPWVPGNTYLPLIPAIRPALGTIVAMIASSSHLLSFLFTPAPKSISKATSSSSEALAGIGTSCDEERKMICHPYLQNWSLVEQYMWAEDQRGIG